MKILYELRRNFGKIFAASQLTRGELENISITYFFYRVTVTATVVFRELIAITRYNIVHTRVHLEKQTTETGCNLTRATQNRYTIHMYDSGNGKLTVSYMP